MVDVEHLEPDPSDPLVELLDRWIKQEIKSLDRSVSGRKIAARIARKIATSFLSVQVYRGSDGKYTFILICRESDNHEGSV